MIRCNSIVIKNLVAVFTHDLSLCYSSLKQQTLGGKYAAISGGRNRCEDGGWALMPYGAGAITNCIEDVDQEIKLSTECWLKDRYSHRKS